jgi:GDP-L-fucose synthase
MIDKKDKIFVTGHKGLVGSAVVRRLNHHGYKNILIVDKKKLDLRRQQPVFNFFKERILLSSKSFY